MICESCWQSVATVIVVGSPLSTALANKRLTSSNNGDFGVGGGFFANFRPSAWTNSPASFPCAFRALYTPSSRHSFTSFGCPAVSPVM
jgi:hypothetical protein